MAISLTLSMDSAPSLDLRNADDFARYVLGVEPHPKQAEWLRARARVKVGCMGRRFGKSFAESVDLIWFAVCNPRSTQFVIAPTADQSHVIMNYVERMLAESPILGASKRINVVKSPFPAVTIGDSEIHARSAGDSGKNVRGHGADRLVLDEAAYINSRVRDAIAPMLADSAIGETILISTSFGHNHFWEEFTRGQAKEDGYLSFQFPSSDNPHVSRSYLEQQRRQMTDLAYRVEYEAEFAEDQNAVFPWSLIERCEAENVDTEPKTGHTYVIGWDPAQFTDRSGVAVLDVTSRPWQLVHCTDIAGRDYPVQEAEIKRLQDRYNGAFVLLDATSHAPVLQHLQAAGVRAEGFTFTNTSKRELIDGTVLAMEQGDLVFPLIPDLVDEMKWYRYEMTASGNVKLGAAENHHDDLVTALALAVFAISSRPRPVTAPPSSLSAPSRWRG